MPFPVLSKTKFMHGMQCHKLLWTELHEPQLVPQPDEVTQHRFDQGHLVGHLAKGLFPNGIDIPTKDIAANIKMTKEYLSRQAPLFEAGISAGNIYSRLDILNPAGDGAWDIIEVKSAASVKDEYKCEVAFQRLCCEGAGLKIRKCSVARINTQYVKTGEIDPQQLFIIEDITDEVNGLIAGELRSRVEEILTVMRMQQCPDVAIGKHCGNPYECPLREICWAFLPEHHVFSLYYGGSRSVELFNRGICAIADIPEGTKLYEKQIIQRDCVKCGQPHINSEAICAFLRALQYPVYYLDFETFSTAIPLLEGTRPYQSIPFQFSLHVVKLPGAEAEHFSYLAEGKDDPRPRLLAELKKLIGDIGSIVAYNSGFEQQVLKDLSAVFPEHSAWVESLYPRIIDLLKPFSNFHYYHPDQKGSASLKKVLPALTGISHEDLAISDGQLAGIYYLDATYGDVSGEERRSIRQHLEEYCGLDTRGMALIVERLYAIIE